MTRAYLIAGSILALGLAACSSQGDANNGNADGGVGGDGSTCGTVISFDPDPPLASSLAPVRAAVNVVDVPGVFTYDWTVTFNGNNVATTMEASDGSQIGFIASTAGPYHVSVTISGAPVPNGCNHADAVANVEAPGANVDI